MQTLSSREVQNHYGEFVEAVQDELVCVTRHGRPLFWAVADRHVRAEDPSVLIGRLLLLHGQLNRDTSPLPGDSFNKVLEKLDASIDTAGLTPADINAMVDAARP
jgi:antitoxin (DNA-binding transcriptional repressor) of toxin-antitoxin stability system